MSEKITVIVEKPVTVTHLVRENLGSVTVQRVSQPVTTRQSVTQQSRRTVSTTILDPRTTTIGLPGVQGPQGEQGPPGLGAATFIFSQPSPLATWHIVHNLGQYPSVMVVNSASELCQGAITYIDENTIDLLFSAPFAGKAFLN